MASKAQMIEQLMKRGKETKSRQARRMARRRAVSDANTATT